MTLLFYINTPNDGKYYTVHTREKLKTESVYDAGSNTYLTTYPGGSYVPIPWITKSSYKVQRAKLWGSDTGRAMTGDFKGTLIGVFPKVTFDVSARYMTGDDIKTLEALTEAGAVSCKYFEQRDGGLRTADFYFDDVTVTYRQIKSAGTGYTVKAEKISVTAIACKKYS